MSKIPIPFIGGGGGLKRTTAFDTRFPGPFHPERELTGEPSGEGFAPVESEGYGLEAAAEMLPDLAVEEGEGWVGAPEAGAQEVAPSPSAASADEPLVEVGKLSMGPADQAGGDSEERAPWDEEPGADQVLLGMGEEDSPEIPRAPDRSPLEFAADVWGEDIGTPELTGAGAPAADEAIAEPEMDSRLESLEPKAEVTPPRRPREPVHLTPAFASEVQPSTEHVELPDFLRILDADREVGEDYEQPGLMGATPGTSDLSDLAAELLAGEHGESMRALMDTLRGEDNDSAIARAFAAGYLAAREGQGE